MCAGKNEEHQFNKNQVCLIWSHKDLQGYPDLTSYMMDCVPLMQRKYIFPSYYSYKFATFYNSENIWQFQYMEMHDIFQYIPT